MGLIGAHIEEARIMGALGMTQTLVRRIRCVRCLPALPGADPLADAAGRWMAAFVLPLVFAASFWRALQRGVPLPQNALRGARGQSARSLPVHRHLRGAGRRRRPARSPLACVGGQFSPAWNVAGYLLAAMLPWPRCWCKLDFNRSCTRLGSRSWGWGCCAPLSRALRWRTGRGDAGNGVPVPRPGAVGAGIVPHKELPSAGYLGGACPTTSLMAGRTLGR